MKRKSYRSYLFLGAAILSLFYLPLALVHGLRFMSVKIAQPFWRSGAYLRASFFPLASSEKGSKEVEELQLENLLLKRQNENLRRRLLSEERIDHQISKLKTVMALEESKIKPFYLRRKDAAKKQLDLEIYSLHAEVIYREHSSWNNTLWIDVGAKHNQDLAEEIVGVGSPVLKGPYLIGVVEYVEKHRSRVRLLTDSTLVPSIRVARGGADNRELFYLLNLLEKQLSLRNEPQELYKELGLLKNRLSEESEERFLAKGELFGTSTPLWRGCSSTLKGIGFNYDFDDEEGPSLELRSGQPLDQLGLEKSLPLIKEGDLLVTTGMDGVFPKDLPVAHVSKVAPLKEGSPSFEIEAKLCAGDLDLVLSVTVLPRALQAES